MKVFVISLKHAATRRASIAGQLERAGVEFEFFDAIEGADRSSEFFDGIDARRYRLNALRDPLPGEVGCYASHLALWRDCVALRRPAVILEDDARLTDGFAERLELIDRLVREYGFVRLQGIDRRRAPLKALRPAAYRVRSLEGSTLSYVSDVPLCMLAYAISPAAASALCNASTTLTAPVDKFLQQTWVHETPVFALEPPLVELSALACETTIGTRPRKSLNPLLLLARAMYKGFGELRRVGFDRRYLSRLELAGPSVAPLADRR